MTGIGRIILVCTMVLAVPAVALGQAVSVSASINPTRVYVGDTAVYTITINNAETQAPPDVAPIPGLDIEYVNASTSSSMRIINGRQSSSRSQQLQYQATPSREGSFIIPAQTVVVDGAPYVTNQVQFVVIEPPVSDLSPLTIEPERATVYVGEPVRLMATWRIGETIEEAFRFVTEQSAGLEWTSGPQPAPTRNSPRVRWDDDVLVGALGQMTTADGAFQTVNAERWFIPLAPGELTLGPVSAVYNVQTGRQSRTIFGQSNSERRMTRSNSATVRVEELPTAGRPGDYTGLVGRYTASASATPLKVRVGDPITLTYEVRSEGPMGRVSAPDLEGDPGVAESFKLDPEGWHETPMNEYGVRRYTTTIRALRDSINSVPPLGFAYFDTRNGEYRRAESRPIPLMVDATREVTAADAIGGGGGASMGSPGVERHPLGAGPGGILANVTSPDALVNQQTLLLDRFEHPVWIAAFAVPPVGYFALLGVIAVRRSADPRARRRAGARRAALATLKSSGDPERAIRTYLSMRFDRSAEALTESDCRALLGGVDAMVTDELAGAMLDGASDRYGSPVAERPSAERVAELLRTIDREAGR